MPASGISLPDTPDIALELLKVDVLAHDSQAGGHAAAEVLQRGSKPLPLWKVIIACCCSTYLLLHLCILEHYPFTLLYSMLPCKNDVLFHTPHGAIVVALNVAPHRLQAGRYAAAEVLQVRAKPLGGGPFYGPNDHRAGFGCFGLDD